MHRSSTLPLYSVFYLHGGIFWDVFHAVYLVFSSEVFWRGFFPWACWPHVLNKSVFMLAHPSYLNVCFCVVHLVVFIFALLCTDSRFCTLPNLASFPGPARSSLAVRNSLRISYCKRGTRRAWERG